MEEHPRVEEDMRRYQPTRQHEYIIADEQFRSSPKKSNLNKESHKAPHFTANKEDGSKHVHFHEIGVDGFPKQPHKCKSCFDTDTNRLLLNFLNRDSDIRKNDVTLSV